MKKQTKRPSEDALHAQVLAVKPTKGQATVLAIIEAAIESYATVGIELTTYDSIANACGVTRPLVQHYFKDKRDLLKRAAKSVRADFQRLAIEAIDSAQTPKEKLDAYVDSTFSWVLAYPKHVVLWKLFYYYCGVDPEMRSLNSELVDIGHSRIAALGGLARPEKKSKDLKERAKLVQTLITGALMTVATENPPSNLKAYQARVRELCRETLFG